jgi:hypothetical protein
MRVGPAQIPASPIFERRTGGVRMPKDSSNRVIRGSVEEIEARAKILELFKQSPIPDEELLLNLTLYLRSTGLAKILYLNELYTKILHIPGIVVEFGVWWGANLALFEAHRSVYEPYNWTRKVVGFDTFQGYQSITSQDGDSPYVVEGGYAVAEGYKDYLGQLLNAHEQDNILAHIQKHELVEGDVIDTIDSYLHENPETIIALAYFDLALYEPTKKCLEAIGPHLVRGSVLAMDELNSHDFPGETIALREVMGTHRYTITRSQFLPDRAYIVIE